MLETTAWIAASCSGVKGIAMITPGESVNPPKLPTGNCGLIYSFATLMNTINPQTVSNIALYLCIFNDPVFIPHTANKSAEKAVRLYQPRCAFANSPLPEFATRCTCCCAAYGWTASGWRAESNPGRPAPLEKALCILTFP